MLPNDRLDHLSQNFERLTEPEKQYIENLTSQLLTLHTASPAAVQDPKPENATAPESKPDEPR